RLVRANGRATTTLTGDQVDLVANPERDIACVIRVAPGLLLVGAVQRETEGAELVDGHRTDSHGSTSSNRASAAMSLSPRPEDPSRTRTSAGNPPARPSMPARIFGRTAIAWAVSSAGRMPSVRVVVFIAA